MRDGRSGGYNAAIDQTDEMSVQTTLDQLLESKIIRPGVPVRLHLGCGAQRLDGYVNIDYSQDHHSVMAVAPDLEADLTTLDFPSQSVAEVRLHHVFEHFSRVVALGSLIRWHEWLEPSGLLLIETPDFIATAEAALAATPRERMAHVRHLEGDQADPWGYHLSHWYPERFRATLTALGFAHVETTTSRTPWHVTPLHNLTVQCRKVDERDRSAQLAAADALLSESMASDEERATWSVWCRQLRDCLAADRHE